MVDESALLRDATSGRNDVEEARRLNQQTYTDEIFGEGFELAFDLESTDELIEKHFRDIRPNTAPEGISPFQCRIGLSTFYVPPLAINVNTQFKAGALSTGALRRQNSPKFNTGNKETLISMTLYFPNFEEIYGTDVRELNKSIHFEESSDEEVDSFLSSLRGLVAQFKYAPFLPVRNSYLNQVHDITAVCMKNLSVSNVAGFPGVLAVELEMYKFNHEVYLPMVSDFNSAIHYGRFRTYMGRAMARIQNETKGLTLWEDGDTIADSEIRTGELGSVLKTPEQIMEKYGFDYTNYGESISLAGPAAVDVREFDFYYPFFVPSAISVPELEDLISEKPNTIDDKSWWDKTLEFLGFNDVNTQRFSSYETIKNMSLSTGEGEVSEGFVLDATEYQEIVLYLQQTNKVLQDMSLGAREDFYNQRLRETGITPGSAAAEELREQVVAGWSFIIASRYTENISFAAMIADDERQRRNINIQEWLVPMQKLNLDRRFVHLQDVNIRIGNKISRLQLQMQDEPTHQHLGGEDTVISLSMIVTGGDPEAIGNIRDAAGSAENELIKLRTMFDTVSGVARLAHSHGTMGFLGVSNAMTDLMGIKYVVPLSFDVRTIPNMPHSYMVTVELVDFDVLQQNRELLDPSQQAYLAEQFGKHNPFLRAKQNFSLFSAYPDFPLDVRDEDNKVVGYLNPSFYFRTFETMPREIMSNDDEDNESPVRYTFEEEGFNWYDDQSIEIEQEVNGTKPRGRIGDPDNIPSNVTIDPELTPGKRYQNAYRPGGLAQHVEDMAQDMAYRNDDGNMIRAFPTYMLWLIDEAGAQIGLKLFDNFYGLQSVIDMSLSRSEDIMADTLMLRVSNLYSNLSTTFQNYLEEDDERSRIVNRFTTQLIRRATGSGGWILDVDSMNIRPGIRVHLRMGYSSDPRRLETVFNGKVTEVHQGEIMTLVCQSDAVELGAIVNSTKKKGHSGKADGAMDNLYLSEPRDLMVTLLSDGANAAKRVISHATRGEIFSENKYGIKHFGMMLYDAPNRNDEARQSAREGTISAAIATLSNKWEDSPVLALMEAGVTLQEDFFTNMASRPDLEIFKRNIYPGNSMGVGQFLGGDLGEIALETAAGVNEIGGVNPDGTFRTDPVSGRANREAEQVEAEDPDKPFSPAAGLIGLASAFNPVGAIIGPLVSAAETDTAIGDAISGLQEQLGIRRSSSDQDIVPEVAFRAQTYMKTVWDLFKVCAAMMPDYIVAVRPFEDRSTVFYGKPHWMYTSGVMPITKGRDLGKLPSVQEPDDDFIDRIMKAKEIDGTELAEGINSTLQRASKTRKDIGKRMDPNSTTIGLNFSGGPSSLLAYPTKKDGVSLASEGNASIEMHLPLSDNLQRDVEHHKQLDSLPEKHRHPYYMDKTGGDSGGSETFSVADQDDTLPGQNGALGYLEDAFDSIEEAALAEQFYVCQRWRGKNGGDWRDVWKHSRIAVLNPENGKAVVCTPTEYGPGVMSRVAGISPDVFHLLGEPQDKLLHYRVMPDDTPLGEINFNTGTETPLEGTGFESFDPTSSTLDAFGAEGVDYDIDSGNYSEDFSERIFLGHRTDGIPVNIDSTGAEFEPGTAGEFDPTDFEQPAELYEGHRAADEAIEVWNNIRSDKYRKSHGGLTDESDHEAAMEDVIMNINDVTRDEAYTWLLKKDFSVGVEKYNEAVMAAAEDGGNFENDVITEVIVAALEIPDGYDFGEREDIPHENTRAWVLTDNFLRIMWQDPFARGWVVRVLDQQDWIDAGQAVQYKHGELDVIFRNVYSSIEGDFLRISSDIIGHMQDNMDKGRKSGGVFAEGLDLVTDITSNILSGLNTFVNGALGFMIGSVMQMFGSVADAFNGEANSNILNQALNDSIYYAEGVNEEGIYDVLQYYADNPFTREYGEPVFEIREPFQRIHHIGSFQHILENQIIESSTNVATIVTASSNNDQPVTVHFDKNTPIEQQVEKTVDTGIFLSEDGFFSRIWNPINSLRDWISSTSGASVSDNKLAERIAASHLKESLKDIYQGEIIILGDPSIRPYDLVYIADSFSKIYGFVEVEQVVHHFTPETGFITTIVPNAVVTVKDPAQFSVLATNAKKQAIHSVREKLRRNYEVKIDAESQHTSQEVPVKELTESAAQEIVGTAQFIGGPTSAMKSLIPNAAFNLEVIEREALQNSPTTVRARTPSMFGAIDFVNDSLGVDLPDFDFVGLWATSLWEKTRDNWIDQSAAHIHYLNKRGRPMDSGLSYADGVAVGQMDTRDITLGGITIFSSNITTGVDGDARINLGDVIPQLQFSEKTGITQASHEVNMFKNEQNMLLKSLSGRVGDGQAVADPSTVRVFLLEVEEVIDADTFDVRAIGQFIDGALDSSRSLPEGLSRIRLAGVDAPEDPFKAVPAEERGQLTDSSYGLRATVYAERVMPVGTRFAFRTYTSNEIDRTFEDSPRALGHAFHTYPLDLTTEDQQDAYMMRTAYQIPLVSYDSFLSDGQPATFDYQLILAGYGDVYISDLSRNTAGVEGARE